MENMNRIWQPQGEYEVKSPVILRDTEGKPLFVAKIGETVMVTVPEPGQVRMEVKGNPNMKIRVPDGTFTSIIKPGMDSLSETAPVRGLMVRKRE